MSKQNKISNGTLDSWLSAQLAGSNPAKRDRIIAELRDWAIITGRPLPYAAEEIADFEMAGICVDLADGTFSDGDAVLNTRVGLSDRGRALYETLCSERAVRAAVAG